MSMRTLSKIGLLFIGALALDSAPAQALEFSGGVSVGGIQIGTGPRLALSPFVGLLWRQEKELLLEVHNMFSVVPGARVGACDRTAVTLVHAWRTGNVSLGPSLSIYSMPVCGATVCNRVVGVASGGHAQADLYFSERFGASVSANVDWAGGSSRVLHGDLMAMVTAGPVWRFGDVTKTVIRITVLRPVAKSATTNTPRVLGNAVETARRADA